MLYEISLAFFLGGIMNLLGVGSMNPLRVSRKIEFMIWFQTVTCSYHLKSEYAAICKHELPFYDTTLLPGQMRSPSEYNSMPKMMAFSNFAQ